MGCGIGGEALDIVGSPVALVTSDEELSTETVSLISDSSYYASWSTLDPDGWSMIAQIGYDV